MPEKSYLKYGRRKQVNQNKQDLNISKNKGRDKETSEYYDEYLRSSKVLRSLRR